MTINERLEKLYSNWKRPNENLVKGGVVDESYYLDSPIKTMVVLKEVNSEDYSDWSLVDLINKFNHNNRYEYLWKIVGIWSSSINHNFPPYKTATYMLESVIYDGLCQIATTNLKKTSGKGTSNYDEIVMYARRDKKLWIEEIKIIDPDIVICGGTFNIIKDILEFEANECDNGAQYGIYDGRVFIEMPHPRARVNKNILYSYYRETMLRLLDKKIIKYNY